MFGWTIARMNTGSITVRVFIDFINKKLRLLGGAIQSLFSKVLQPLKIAMPHIIF